MTSAGDNVAGHSKALRDLCDLLIAAVTSHDCPTTPNLQQVDWPSVIALAHSYKTLAILANSWIADDPSLPAGARVMFGDLATGAKAHTATIVDQIVGVTRLANRAGVVPVFLKGGAHIVQELYPNAAMRSMSDIDILVPEEKIEECSNLLMRQGYAPVEKLPTRQWHHWYGLAHKEKPLIVELHRWPISFPYNRKIRAEDIMADAVSHRLGDGEAAVPSDFHSAALAIAHSQLLDRDYLLGRVELRRLVDVHLLAQGDPTALTEAKLRSWFRDRGAGAAFEYHQRWMDFMQRGLAPTAKGIVSQWLFRRAHFLSGHPKTLSLSVRMIRPWIALRRDLSDPLLRQELAGNLARPQWWKRQFGVFSDGK